MAFLRKIRRNAPLPLLITSVGLIMFYMFFSQSAEFPTVLHDVFTPKKSLKDLEHGRNSISVQPNKPLDSEDVNVNGANAENDLIDWHNYTLIEIEKKHSGPGEQGASVVIAAGQEEAVQKGYRENGFNAVASDQISLSRSVNDIRHPLCKQHKYHRHLPTASVVIPFHQEHWSTLLRTVISSIIRAPSSLLKEVILVDDFSTKPFLKEPLEKYMREHYPDVVKIVRMPRREGLIRTRIAGAKVATSDVIIFLDSHCEANTNWLPPLLEPISQNYKTVTCPFIDVISAENFAYVAQDEGARGAFDWEFYYKRLARLPEDDQHPIEPFDSPVMAGGLFAISRKWFWELGGYDPGLDIWGGEQYELSFKIWQCGGRMVDTPCSRIGHIYRKFAPFPNPGIGDFISKNYKRVAEVWMDEYKEYLYMRNPQRFNSTDAGDLSEQKAIRERLKCKPFKWFMEEVAFDLPKRYPPIPLPPFFKGEIRNVARGLCLDGKFQEMHAIGVADCVKNSSKQVNGEQTFEFDFLHEIKPVGRQFCLDYAGNDVVLLFPCHGSHGNQEWIYRVGTQQIYHPSHHRCLDVKPGRTELIMNTCDPASETQKWAVENANVPEMRREFNGQ